MLQIAFFRFNKLVLMFLLPAFLQAQVPNTQSFYNTTPITIPDVGPVNVYPSQITVGGMPDYVVEVQVHFENVFHEEGFTDVDILLEAPNGKKVLLCSDALYNYLFVAIYNLSFRSSNFPFLTGEGLSDGQTIFHPTNIGTTDDVFPAPGPGAIVQPKPSMHDFDGINPNGTWKLWIVSDDDNGAVGNFGDFGWELRITATNGVVCARPDYPEMLVVEDTFATVQWNSYGNTSQWEVYYGIDPVPTPDVPTVPTIDNITQSTNVSLSGLQPNRNYSFWVRSDCGGAKSQWIGPTKFLTAIYPCESPFEVSLCETFNLTNVTPFTHWKPNTCSYSADGTAKRVISFTPPISGEYLITGIPTGPANGHIAYKAATQCDTSGWTCIFDNNGLRTDLEGGTTYWFFFDGVTGTSVKFDACPFELPSTASLTPISLTPSTSQFRWHMTNGQAPPGEWDILYQLSTNPAPNYQSSPTVSDIQLSATGHFNLQEDLTDGATYNMYIRRNCGDQWTCWNTPTTFHTPAVVATATQFQVDTNYNFAFFTFITLSWGFDPSDATDVQWKASWKYSPFDTPVEQGGGNMVVGPERVTFQLNNLSPSRTYDLWVKPIYPPGEQLYPYWAQDWQGPLTFSTIDNCDIYTGDLLCGTDYKIGHISFGYHYNHMDLPPTACPPDSTQTDWEAVYKFVSPVTGPISIVPLQAIGDPGPRSLVFYKKASQGCWIADGWENLGCWDMGTVPETLTFPAEKDSSYLIAFDTRQINGQRIVDDFAFRIEGCDAPCPPLTGLECIETNDTSVVIRWEHIDPNQKVTVEYTSLTTGFTTAFDSILGPTYEIKTLNPGEPYLCWVRYRCNGLDLFTENILYVRTGSENPNTTLSKITYCNPMYHRPGGDPDQWYHYDAMQGSVNTAGTYQFQSLHRTCNNFNGGHPIFVSIYQNQFDPENPWDNLIAYSDSTALTQTPTTTSANLVPGTTYWFVYAVPKPMTDDPYYLTSSCILHEVNGPDFPVLSAPLYLGKQPAQQGIVKPSEDFDNFYDYGCLDTLGWYHFYQDGLSDETRQDDYLLASIEFYPKLTEDNHWPLMQAGGGSEAIQMSNPPTTYLLNPSGWFVMNRYWDISVDPYNQPNIPIKVRFYFNDQDFLALRDSILAAGGTPPDSIQQLYFYKINDFFDRFEANPATGHEDVPIASTYDSDGYWEYNYGPEATDSTWRYLPYKNDHSAEMLIRHFSGGGGGIGGNLLGASVWVRPPVVKPNVRIYPNPTYDKLIIDGIVNYPNTYATVYDMMGRLHMDRFELTNESIALGQLPAGNYLLTLEIQGKLYSWQIIKF